MGVFKQPLLATAQPAAAGESHEDWRMALDLLTPLGLGLLGFIEPCSLGANAIFLSYVAPLARWRRIVEAFTFTLSRGVFLGLLSAHWARLS